MERPHSRKKKIAEGTAEVKKGELVEDSVQAGNQEASDGQSEQAQEGEEA